jgi:hypothetical protein
LNARERRESPARRLQRLEAMRENQLIRELFEQQLSDLNPPAKPQPPKLRLYMPSENS